MSEDLEVRMVECMKPLFGDYAETAFAQQKAKLGISGPGRPDDYVRLATEIKAMCDSIAGAGVAERVYEALLSAVQEAS